MGVFGAAFATVFSQAVAGLGSLWYILKHYNEDVYKRQRPTWPWARRCWML